MVTIILILQTRKQGPREVKPLSLSYMDWRRWGRARTCHAALLFRELPSWTRWWCISLHSHHWATPKGPLWQQPGGILSSGWDARPYRTPFSTQHPDWTPGVQPLCTRATAMPSTGNVRSPFPPFAWTFKLHLSQDAFCSDLETSGPSFSLLVTLLSHHYLPTDYILKARVRREGAN